MLHYFTKVTFRKNKDGGFIVRWRMSQIEFILVFLLLLLFIGFISLFGFDAFTAVQSYVFSNVTLSIIYTGTLLLALAYLLAALGIRHSVRSNGWQINIVDTFFGIPYFKKTFTSGEFRTAVADYRSASKASLPAKDTATPLRIDWECDAWVRGIPEWLSFYCYGKRVWTVGNKHNLKQIMECFKEAAAE